MKLLISGSRKINKEMQSYVTKVIERLKARSDVLVMVGDNPEGIDALITAEMLKADLQKRVKIIGAYQKCRNTDALKANVKVGFFNGSYTERDKFMADQVDMVLGIWNGSSKGTKAVCDYAKKVGKKVTLKEFNKEV